MVYDPVTGFARDHAGNTCYYYMNPKTKKLKDSIIQRAVESDERAAT